MAKAKKLPSGRWRVRVYLYKDKNNVEHYKSFTADTARQAQYLAAKFSAEQSKSEIIDKITVHRAYQKYIESKSNVLSPSTIREYIRQSNNDFQELMNIPISMINQENVQIAVNNAALNHSPKTVRNMHGLLVSVLKTYRPNFVLNTKLPQNKKTQVYIPSEEEIKTIYNVVKNTEMEAPFLLASQVGMRAGEICALDKTDINLRSQTIRINKSLAYDGKKYVVKQPKTYAGNRTVPVHKSIIELLSVLEPYNKEITGSPIIGMHTNAITHKWEHVLKRAGIQHFKFHALRHYFASQALLKGIPKKYVAELMGHESSIMLDKVYEHTFETEKAKMAKEMIALTENLIT